MTQRRSALTALVLPAAVLLLVAGQATAQPAVPGAPTNLQAVVSGNALSLTWTAPSSGGTPTGYTLVARTAPGGPVLVAIPLGNVTSFAATGPNGVFVLSVQASNASGAGPESSSVTVTLPTVPAPPGAPTGLVASAAGNTATFTWNPPSTGGVVANYVLTAGLTPGFAVPLAALPLPGSSPGTVVPGVPAGTYYVRVVAQNAGGTSAPTNEAVLTVAGPAAPGAPTMNQPTGSGNTLHLSWSPGGAGAPTSYVLTALTTGGAVIASVPLAGTAVSFANVPNGTYVLQVVAVNAVGASPASNQVSVTLPITGPPPPIAQIGNDITSSDGSFGNSVALSANGQRLAIGAFTTANGTTRVYERTGNTWTQIGADIIGEAAGDRAGFSLDFNDAGTRLAIGAYLNDAGGSSRGQVRVYDLVGGAWTQVGQDLDGAANGYQQGWCVALSADGSRLVTCVQRANSTTGDVKVFDLVAGTWTQVGSTLSGGNEFGWAADISGDGTTIAVGVPSAAASSRIGTAQVYRLVGGDWAPLGSTLGGREIADNFGDALSLSFDGSRIVVVAPSDNPDGGNNNGRTRVFEFAGGVWSQVGQDVVGGEGEGVGAEQESVQLSADGTRFVVIAPGVSLARVYRQVSGTWTQVGADITPNAGAAVRAGGVALSSNGGTAAVGWINGSPRRVRVFSITP